MAKVIIDKRKIEDFLNSRYIDTIYPSKEQTLDLMSSGKQMTFYLGIDPTGSDLHLGHTTNLFILKKLAKLGHKVVLLIGDFTAQTGDPTGKDDTRKVLSAQEVKSNMKTYIEQVSKILTKGSFKIKYNSQWLTKLTFTDIRKLARLITVQQMTARDMFKKRLASNKSVTIEEFLYPLMQGYDSVAMEVDGEVGGTDQTFNMMVGRDLVKSILGKDKIVITTKLLEDRQTGKKLMSKSEGHYISLQDGSGEMFGRVMALPDSVILDVLAYATEVSGQKIAEIKKRQESGENPKVLKEELAFELVRSFFGEKAAEQEKNEFERVFSQHQLPEDIKEISVDIAGEDIVGLIFKAGIINSKTEIKRLVGQKAVKVDDRVVENWGEVINISEDGVLLKIGPRRFYRIKRKN